VKGTGTRFVGNSIENFGPGDLILIGSNLPHYWRNSQEYYEPDSTLTVQAIVVRFLYSPGGVHLFDIPEMNGLKKLLEESAHGLKVTGTCVTSVAAVMEEMLVSLKEKKVLLLLKALSIISSQKENRLKLMNSIAKPINQLEIERINNIYEYMLKNYTEKITLPQIASVANMQTAAFCRYFKKHFRKTFIDALNEIRINEACNLLRKKDGSITSVAYASGFNNLSNFIKVFHKVTGHKPKLYQQQFLS
jgi:AraC-like DNA-binding protein